MLKVIIGFLSGIISGMGIGGGAILIPALLFITSVSQQTAQGINLVYFLPTAAVSLIVHIKKKNVEIKTAAVIGVFGIIGSICGAYAAAAIGGGALRKMFGIFLLLIGAYEIYKGIRMTK